MLKNIGFIVSLLFLTSCSRYSEIIVEKYRCESSFSQSIQEGALEATATRQHTYEVEVNYYAGTHSRTLEDTRQIESCTIEKCKEGFVEYNNQNFKITPNSYNNMKSYEKLCIPAINSCQELLVKIFPGISAGILSPPLSTFIEIVNKRTLECSEEENPFSCAEGYSINNLNPENLSCSASQVSCTEGELTAGASTGLKYFDTETNSYASCQIMSCLETYTLNETEGICELNTPGPVYGCMDTRAANYNSLATQEDLSCMCSEGIIYNPITGCSEEPMDLPF